MILALVYGYIPYFILPVFAGLDRTTPSQIEAARLILGATPFRAFLHVTLPLPARAARGELRWSCRPCSATTTPTT